MVEGGLGLNKIVEAIERSIPAFIVTLDVQRSKLVEALAWSSGGLTTIQGCTEVLYPLFTWLLS